MAFADKNRPGGDPGIAFWDSLQTGGLNGVAAKPPPVPSKFFVTIADNETSYRFFMSDPQSPPPRPYRSSYNIYFLPISAATPAQMSNQQGSSDAFKLATIAASAAAPVAGGDVAIESSAFFGMDGWFFCTAYSSRYLLESDFNGPVRSPIIQTDLNTAIPPPVGDQSVALTDVTILGRTVAKLDFQASVPSEYVGVIAITIDNPGSGYTTPPAVSFTSSTGTGAAAIAAVEGGLVTSIRITDAGNGYQDAPAVVFTGGGGSAAAATASIGQATIFSGYQLYIEGYQSDPAVYESVSVARDLTLPPGGILRGTLYLVPDYQPFPTDTTFYFVSISPHGERRADVTSAPSATIIGGIT